MRTHTQLITLGLLRRPEYGSGFALGTLRVAQKNVIDHHQSTSRRLVVETETTTHKAAAAAAAEERESSYGFGDCVAATNTHSHTHDSSQPSESPDVIDCDRLGRE